MSEEKKKEKIAPIAKAWMQDRLTYNMMLKELQYFFDIQMHRAYGPNYMRDQVVPLAGRRMNQFRAEDRAGYQDIYDKAPDVSAGDIDITLMWQLLRVEFYNACGVDTPCEKLRGDTYNQEYIEYVDEVRDTFEQLSPFTPFMNAADRVRKARNDFNHDSAGNDIKAIKQNVAQGLNAAESFLSYLKGMHWVETGPDARAFVEDFQDEIDQIRSGNHLFDDDGSIFRHRVPVEIKAVDQAEHPVAGALCTIKDQAGNTVHAAVIPYQDSYEYDLMPGKYAIIVSCASFPDQTIPVTIPEDSLQPIKITARLEGSGRTETTDGDAGSLKPNDQEDKKDEKDKEDIELRKLLRMMDRSDSRNAGVQAMIKESETGDLAALLITAFVFATDSYKNEAKSDAALTMAKLVLSSDHWKQEAEKKENSQRFAEAAALCLGLSLENNLTDGLPEYGGFFRAGRLFMEKLECPNLAAACFKSAAKMGDPKSEQLMALFAKEEKIEMF